LHGHTHERIQYVKTGTVVSCNPRGNYVDSRNGFDHSLIIDTSSELTTT